MFSIDGDVFFYLLFPFPMVPLQRAGAPGSIFNPYKSTVNDLARRRRTHVANHKTNGGGPGGPGGPGGGGGGGAVGSGVPRSTSSHAAAMLGQVGVTTVAVSEADRVS